MGTNYYLLQDPCPTCGHEKKEVHIGKSSGGWCFSLHVIPDEGIMDLSDWERIWTNPKNCIRDGYGGFVAPDEMRRIITERA